MTTEGGQRRWCREHVQRQDAGPNRSPTRAGASTSPVQGSSARHGRCAPGRAPSELCRVRACQRSPHQRHRPRDANGVVRARNLVTASGGHVVRQLPIIDGFSAKVPSGAVALLKRDASIIAVTRNAKLKPQALGYSSVTDMGSMFNVTLATGAQAMWAAGYTGDGVDVALIDSGVVAVDGLKGGFINGPDLSFESQSPSRRYLDTFGHGTHLAGIITGRANAQSPAAMTAIPPTSSAWLRTAASSPSRSPTRTVPRTSPRSSPRSTGSSSTARTTA